MRAVSCAWPVARLTIPGPLKNKVDFSFTQILCGLSTGFYFLYWWFAPYSRTFHLYHSGRHRDGRRADRAPGVPSQILPEMKSAWTGLVLKATHHSALAPGPDLGTQTNLSKCFKVISLLCLSVDKRERQAGHDPVKELAEETKMQEINRTWVRCILCACSCTLRLWGPKQFAFATFTRY